MGLSLCVFGLVAILPLYTCNNYIFSRSVNNNRPTVTLAANQLNYNYNCTNLASAGTFICHLRQGGYVFTWRLSVRLSVCIFCLPQMYLCTTKIRLNRGSRPCLDSSVPLLILFAVVNGHTPMPPSSAMAALFMATVTV